MWIQDLYGDSRKARPGSHIDKIPDGGEVKVICDQDAVQKMSADDLLELCHGGQVHDLVGLSKQFIILFKLLRLPLRDADLFLFKPLFYIFLSFIQWFFLCSK